MSAWLYIPGYNGDPHTVGFYKPDGEWVPESDHSQSEDAAKRVHYLNGGKDHPAGEAGSEP